MSHLEHPLFNPFAGSKALTEDALSKGMMSPEAAERQLKASAWVDANIKELVKEFGTDMVLVAADDDADGGMAFYPGGDLFECWTRARQFGPEDGWVLFDPGASSVSRVLVDVPEIGLSPIEAAISLYGGVGPFFQQDGGGELDEETRKKLAELMREVIAEAKKKRLEKIEDGLTKGEYDGLLPEYFLGRQINVGGALTDGKKTVPKDYLVDTGATSSLISKSNFDKLVRKGAKPKKLGEGKAVTAGGIVTVPFYGGLTMQFARKDVKGKAELVNCSTPLAVGSHDLLGVDQLKNTKTKLEFDPAKGKVDLVASP